MISVIKKSEVATMMPARSEHSHKGENGRVLVIGGSLDYFGAPLLAALGALGSGADLVTLLVPECNFEVSRNFYPDFIVRKYPGNYVNTRTLDVVAELLPKTDCVLMGPGVSEDPESLRVMSRIIEKTSCQIVLDAEAIPAVANLGLPPSSGNSPHSRITITPNRAEMDEITEGALPRSFEEQEKLAEEFAHKWGVTLLFKRPHDVIAAPGKPTRINQTGNPGMTVGGTGDVLAGVVASLIAQHAAPYEAAQCAAFFAGATGDQLYKQKGYHFTASDLAHELPYAIHEICD